MPKPETLRVLLLSLCLALCPAGLRGADDPLAAAATWSVPADGVARAAFQTFLEEFDLPVSAEQQAGLTAIWDAPESADVSQPLDRTVRALAVLLPGAKEVADACAAPYAFVRPPGFAILEDGSRPYVRNNLHLRYGIWLVQNGLYDEALVAFEGLTPTDVVDPASLLFFRAVAEHRLIRKDEALASLKTLMENEQTIPDRFAVVARLMQADLGPLETDSLDEVARIMRNVENRLDKGRAGTRVRDEEGHIVAKLDKMIEELEKQQQQQQQQQGGAGGSNPSSPMQDSMPGGGSGPGDVDPKDVDPSGAWGNLPAKERQEALQDLARDLPAHYREVIEEYFRKLARDEK